MPKILHHHRPITLRSCFSPERVVEAPKHSLRSLVVSEPLSEVTTQVSPRMEPGPTRNNDGCDLKIKKPAGFVGRPGPSGYSLKDVLNWEEGTYESTRVSCLELIVI